MSAVPIKFRDGFATLVNALMGTLGRRDRRVLHGPPALPNDNNYETTAALHEATLRVSDPAHIAVELKDPYVLLYDKRLVGLIELMPLLEATARAGRPLLIFAADFDNEILSALAINKLRGSSNVMAVKAGGLGSACEEQLQDIAVLTSGMLVTEELGRSLQSIRLHELGQAKRVMIDRDRTTLIAGAGKPEAINAWAKQLRAQLKDTRSDQDKSRLHERLAKLMAGVAVIRVAAASEA